MFHKISLKTFIFFISSFILSVSISCTKKVKEEPPQVNKTVKIPLDIYSKLDVCGCNKEAIEIVDFARDIRNEFQSIEQLKKQEGSVKQIRELASSYVTLLESCFRRHASKNFIPSECNKLKELDKKRSELSDLGIPLVQGERIKL